MNTFRNAYYLSPVAGAVAGALKVATDGDPKDKGFFDQMIFFSLFGSIALPTLPFWLPLYLYLQTVEETEDD